MPRKANPVRTRIKQPALTPDALLAEVRRMTGAGRRKLAASGIDALDRLTARLEEDRKEARAWVIAAIRSNARS